MTDATKALLPVTLNLCPNPWCTRTARPLAAFSSRSETWRVVCACGVQTFGRDSEAEAVAEWNRRGDDAKDTVDLVRHWLMSGDEPVSNWEREFAAAIDARQSHSLPRDVGMREALSELWSIVHGCDLRLSVPMETIHKVRAALAHPAQATHSALSGDAGEGGGHWLIERRCNPPQWSVAPRPTGVGAFYSDIHRAHRFASKHDASEAMRAMSITEKERGEYFVSEHVWIEHD